MAKEETKKEAAPVKPEAGAKRPPPSGLEKRRSAAADVAKLRDEIMQKGNREFKDEGFRTSEDMLGNVRGFVKTGIVPLDVILGGEVGRGFALGRSSELLGEADVGKTTIGLLLLRNIQAQGGLGIVIDTEKTLTSQRLSEMGVDIARLVVVEDNVIESICDRILFILEKLKDRPGVIVWDTIASTKSRRDKGRKIGESMSFGRHAQILSAAFRAFAEPLAASRAALIMVNQRKEGGIGDMFVTERKRDATLGGGAMKFHPSQRLKLSFLNTRKAGEEKGSHQAMTVSATMLKNKIQPTRLQARLLLRTTGEVAQFDDAASIIETMVKWGEFNKEGRVLMADAEGGAKHTRVSFSKAYKEDAEFRLRMGRLVEDAHRRLNLREA